VFDVQQTVTPDVEGAFTERFVDADGFHIRYLEAGSGPPLVCLHGASGLLLTLGHEQLSHRFRVIAFEMPGFGQSPENTRTNSVSELAGTLANAINGIGVETFSLLGWSFGSRPALWLALQQSGRVSALVLEAPGAIRVGPRLTPRSAEETAALLFQNPQKRGLFVPSARAVQEKERALVARIRGPEHDPSFQERMRGISTPTLVLFGTEDRLCSPDAGHIYVELMPNASLVLVYNAAHAISGDRPEAFVEVVSDFLERREAFVISRRDTQIFP
jgi:pimeloyl-ACP methyl ester carboxylesterase